MVITGGMERKVLGVVLVLLLFSVPGAAAQQSEPDLREANVMEVEYQESGENSYRFDVTLYHDDDGEEGYANWWQVETLGGKKLGRRELAHPHGTREFTRSESINIPSSTEYVVVRGHDQTHGYGGLAMVVNLKTWERGGGPGERAEGFQQLQE